jgi:hypothetical protein
VLEANINADYGHQYFEDGYSHPIQMMRDRPTLRLTLEGQEVTVGDVAKAAKAAKAKEFTSCHEVEE